MAATFEEVERAFHAVLAARERGGAEPLDEQAIVRVCGGDTVLAAEVRSLIRHFEMVGEPDDGLSDGPADAPTRIMRFLDPEELHANRVGAAGQTPPAMLDAWGASPVGQRLGDFTLIGERGSGGMGVVFIAQQERPRRTVALKLVRRHAATAALIHRFDREAQLLARLNHPGVAQVYAAGVADLATAAGNVSRVPYIAMELVDGPNLLEYVRARASDTPMVLRLIAQVCDAVQHAHVRGVIHRDLKPPNILVASGADGNPQVKVLDFGVARQSDPTDADESPDAPTRYTDHGSVLGTLSYMSPEQVRSERDVDARTDVYAIGAILYQLLASALPIDVRNCSLPEAARRIVELEPAPSGSVQRALRGDIETIVATALQKDPARRYQSPAELARDIRHHLAGEPIQARRDSLVYVLGKRAARYQTLTYAAAALLLVVAAAAAYSWQQQRASARAERIALAAQSKATDAQDDAERAASRLAAELSASRIDQGRLLGAAGDLASAERLLWDEYFANPQRQSSRWALWELYSTSGCLKTIVAQRGECRALSLTADGSRFATGGDEPIVRIWSVPIAEKLAEPDTGLTSVHAVSFSNDGKRIAVAGEGGAVLVEVDSAVRRALGPSASTARGVSFAANDLAVAVGSDDGFVRLFDPNSGEILNSLGPSSQRSGTSAPTPPALRAVRFDASCTRLAAAYADGTVRLWNAKLSRGSAEITPGPRIAGRPGTTGYGVDFSPDGALLASGSSDRTLALWRTADGEAMTTIETNNGSARSAAFTSDGQVVAVPGFWRTQLFDVGSGRPAQPRNLPALGHGASHVSAFTPDGNLLIATGSDGICRLWDLSANPTTVLPSTPAPVRDLAIARVNDEYLLACIQSDGELRLRARRGQSAAWREALRCNVVGAAQTLSITVDGRWIVVGRADGHVITFTSDGQIVQDVAAHAEGVNVVRISADGACLVSGGSDDITKIWRRHPGGTGWELAATLNCGGDVIGAAVRPDGRFLATTARPGQLQFWKLPGGESIGQITLAEMPWRLAFSPDSRRLAAGSWDRAVHVFDTTEPVQLSAQPALTLHGHSQLVLNEAFDDTSELLASVSNDGALRIWDLSALGQDDTTLDRLDRRRCLVTLNADVGDSLSVAFLPSGKGGGKSVAVGYYDGSIRVWDLNFFDRHVQGQLDYQRALRIGATTKPR